jgi:hypothetical protein
MYIATPRSLKSPIMQEIRLALQAKPKHGKPTPSKKIARKIWREQFLGILSEDAKDEIAKKKTLLEKKRSLPRKPQHSNSSSLTPRTEGTEIPQSQNS